MEINHTFKVESRTSVGFVNTFPGVTYLNDTSTAHTTMMRWVHQYISELAKKTKQHLKISSDSYGVDEGYVKVKVHWEHLYRAVDFDDGTLDWMLSTKRNKNVAECFFKKTLRNLHCCSPNSKAFKGVI